MERYIEVNNRITKESLRDRKANPSVVDAHMQRHREEFQLFQKYIRKDSVILDVGCKDGLWLEVLRNNGFENLVATDTCDEAISEARSKGFAVNKMDAQDMSKFLPEYFDAVSILHTLEHVPEPKKVVAEIYRLLKNDGICFVEVPTQPVEPPEDWGHFHCFTREEEVTEIFENSGFQLLEIQRMDPPSKKPWHRYIFKKLKWKLL